MIKICFICHGNICRSPMAEFVFKNKIRNLNSQNKFLIVSRSTSHEEVGNDMHDGVKDILNKNNIVYTKHISTPLVKEDYDKYDFFICMDDNNVRNTLKIFTSDNQKKVFKLLKNKDVKDPWYTLNFSETYNDIDIGTDKLIEMFKNDINN